MKRTIKKTAYLLLLTLSTILLFGCGGGSSSSGVGSPAPTPYAGVYNGVVNVSAQGSAGSVTDSLNFRIVVGVDGEVTGYVPGSSGSGSCEDSGKRYYLNDNILADSGTINCYFPSTGSCSVQFSERVVFNIAAGSLSGSYKLFCPAETVTMQISGYLPKTSS
jgi:hypothetical protein